MSSYRVSPILLICDNIATLIHFESKFLKGSELFDFSVGVASALSPYYTT